MRRGAGNPRELLRGSVARSLLYARPMRTRSLVPLFVASVALAGACSEFGSPANGNAAGYQNLTAPTVPVPMTFAPDNHESEAALFEDHDLNMDVIQVYAYEDSFGSGIFVQFPAA